MKERKKKIMMLMAVVVVGKRDNFLGGGSIGVLLHSPLIGSDCDKVSQVIYTNRGGPQETLMNCIFVHNKR